MLLCMLKKGILYSFRFCFKNFAQGTAIKERIQERLKAQSRDFGLLQYDEYEYDSDDEEDEEFQDVKE
jgi:hypothetical protein